MLLYHTGDTSANVYGYRQMSMDIGKCQSRPYSPDHVSLLQHIMSTNRCLGCSYSQYIQRHYMTSAEQLIHAIYLPRRMSMNVGACLIHAINILYSH